MKKLLIITIACMFFCGCKENDLVEFSADDSFISFALPDLSNRPKERFLDSVYYSFATDTAIGLQEKTIAIPIAIGGVAKHEARNYSYEINQNSDYDRALIEISEPTIAAERYVDTLYVKIKRAKELGEKEMVLILNLKDNENFKVGHQYNSELKIVFSDIMIQPTWWNAWSRVLGPFYKEVMQKWMQIYYLGADMSPHLTTNEPGPVYYWNNMPSSANPSWYPITFMYIEVMKNYFQENVIYPDGDTSKERILLP
ncbi:DUF4843 domain-containing protein [Sphingobacterium hotanense]|uniref:DUF4843 domain-containing protein n=1 Tax=Sphingobacterium hotanense TaxID=649196 RepID=UPI0011F3DC0F|nr:DUF4843 domain-containing protein [Sphingobacterium hotanense]